MFSKRQPLFAFSGFLFAWFAVITQFVIHLIHAQTGLGETLFRFFSFFTLLTNIVVAVFFTASLIPASRLHQFFTRPGHSTAIAVYITVVALVYHLLLRNI